MKSNSFSKWKAGVWAPGCAAEIGLAVVDMQELPRVEDAIPKEKWTPYFYSVMEAFEKRCSPLFAEVKRWLFISGSESHRSQTMEFVNSQGAFKSLHMDFADYHPAKFERLGDLSVGRATRKVILTFLQDVDCSDQVEICPDFFPPQSSMYTKPHGLLRAGVPGVQHRTPNGVLLVAGVRVLPSGGEAILSIFGGVKITCVAMVSHASA